MEAEETELSTEPATQRRKADGDRAAEDGESAADVADRPKPKRFQVSKACQRCKRLQKGCSDSRPCRRCITAGLQHECLPQYDVLASRARQQLRGSQPGGHVVTALFPRSPEFASAWHLAQSPTATFSVPHSYQPFVKNPGLLHPEVVDYCFQRFFARLSPTIPILTPDFVAERREQARSLENGGVCYGLIAAVCAMVLFQVEEADAHSLGGLVPPQSNAAHGRLLFEEALAVRHALPSSANPSLEDVLFSFFLYACNAALFHHSQAFLFLREATTLFILLKVDPEDSTAKMLSARLFWVLLVTERSHAIRYRRPITLQVTADSPEADADSGDAGFWGLVALFKPLDTSFMSLLNQERVHLPPAPAALAHIETCISHALDHALDLHDTQKANLRVTQLWLGVVLWKILLRLGFLSEQASSPAFAYHHPLHVAKELVLSTRDLPVDSIQVHGVGITEKLFDVACAVVDVLASVPLSETDRGPGAMHPEGNLRYVRNLISKLPGGVSTYEPLLDKHIELNLPNFTFTV